MTPSHHLKRRVFHPFSLDVYPYMLYNFYMTYKVAVDIRAAKEIGKLDTKIQQRVMDAIRSIV